jgi:hypothetical protein
MNKRRIPLLRQSKFFLVTLLTFALSACATGQQSNNSPKQVGRKTSVMIDAVSKEDVSGKTFVFPDEDKSEDVEAIREFQLAKNALKLAGMTESDSAEKADYSVALHTETKKPVLGISIGAINPYTHTVSLTAKRNNKIAWQVKASGNSEFESRGRFLGLLLGAAEEYIGDTTGSPVRIQIASDDSRVEEVLSGKKQIEATETSQE